MLNDLIDHKIMIEYEPEFVWVAKVTWKKDFGPWTNWQYCEQIRVCFETGLMEELDSNNNVIRSCNLKLEVDSDA